VPDTVTKYTDVPAWLDDSNLKAPNLLCMFGSGVYNGVVEPGSIHLAGAIGGRDATTDGIPFWSPSNFTLECEGIVHAGRELHLTPDEAAYLNSQGIVTGINMIGGLKCWGDQTTAYPGVTDVKDSSIPIRRMFTWIGNTLVLTSWQFVSSPVRRRLVETVQDTFNIWLNGLTAREYILGGRVTFEQADNPTTDLMDGKVRWHVYITPPQAARELTFILEYDPAYLKTLFGASSEV
jgi:phage tail sheath protein FI